MVMAEVETYNGKEVVETEMEGEEICSGMEEEVEIYNGKVGEAKEKAAEVTYSSKVVVEKSTHKVHWLLHQQQLSTTPP